MLTLSVLAFSPEPQDARNRAAVTMNSSLVIVNRRSDVLRLRGGGNKYSFHSVNVQYKRVVVKKKSKNIIESREIWDNLSCKARLSII